MPSATVSCIPDKATVEKDMQFLGYVAKYGKNYKSKDEFEARRGKWQKTDEWITAFQNEKATFTVSHNKFSDWTDAEKSQVLGAVLPWGLSTVK